MISKERVWWITEALLDQQACLWQINTHTLNPNLLTCPIMIFFNPPPSLWNWGLHRLINEHPGGNLGHKEGDENEEGIIGSSLDQYITVRTAKKRGEWVQAPRILQSFDRKARLTMYKWLGASWWATTPFRATIGKMSQGEKWWQEALKQTDLDPPEEYVTSSTPRASFRTRRAALPLLWPSVQEVLLEGR